MVRDTKSLKILTFCSVDQPEMSPKWPEVKAVTMKEKWKKHQFTQVREKIVLQFRWLKNSLIEMENVARISEFSTI